MSLPTCCAQYLNRDAVRLRQPWPALIATGSGTEVSSRFNQQDQQNCVVNGWIVARAWAVFEETKPKELLTLRVSEVLQKYLSGSLGAMHALRSRVLLRAVKAAAREREPWLIVASPELTDLSARQLITLYAHRMQIELSFRDRKSHRYGQGFEDSLTRSGPRIEILLLVNAFAAFASWLAGMVCEASGIAHCCLRYTQTLLDPAHWTRSARQAMADGANIAMVGSTAIASCLRA